LNQSESAFRADAVKTAGVFVGALSELTARVQIRQHQFHCGHFEFRMHVDRNAAAVVADGNRAVHVHGHFDFCAITGEMFIDRVVENFENHVVQSALVRIADIHSGALPHRLQTFQFIDLSRVVFLTLADASGVGLAFTIVRVFVFYDGQNSGWHMIAKR
jgi:hypothetical protein